MFIEWKKSVQNVIIDACSLHRNSGFLQQAADITGGVYLKVDETLSLLQHLLWLYLPSHQTRDKLILPSSQDIDYRAACFCHRKLVDIGFVCSVCLSSKNKVNACCKGRANDETTRLV
ncbi:hypothetical protein QZH41_013268 [Actinostola sp. cb2023]|nr:hypothetical protein QZH41_013268 [Actinostola sp. cb2023]